MRRIRQMLVTPLALLSLLSTALADPPRPAATPQISGNPAPISIKVTTVPLAGPGGEEMFTIAGNVMGAPKDAVIVIWARSAESIFWVQPRGDSYRTRIEQGRFSTLTHPGLEYVVAVTRPTFRSQMTRTALPKVEGEVLAMITVPGR